MKHYIINSVSYDALPDPLNLNEHKISPMSDALFRELGGVIIEDGEPTPADRVRIDFAALLADLAKKVQGVTIDDFKTAARTLHSGELVAWAREHDVPDDVIAEARSRIVEILADAMREGMTWTDLLK